MFCYLFRNNCSEQHYKPGSVLDDHLSLLPVTRQLPRCCVARRTRRHDGPPYRLLFRLASDGVYTASARYRGSGGLLHRHSTLTADKSAAVSFLLHWPWSHLHRTLSGILPYEARTFLTCRKAAAITYLTYTAFRVTHLRISFKKKYIFKGEL